MQVMNIYLYASSHLRRGGGPSKSIYNIEKKANVVCVGTDIKFKIFSGKLLDVAPKSQLADGLVTDYSRWSGCDFVACKDG
jgi:hypothetical protein